MDDRVCRHAFELCTRGVADDVVHSHLLWINAPFRKWKQKHKENNNLPKVTRSIKRVTVLPMAEGVADSYLLASVRCRSVVRDSWGGWTQIEHEREGWCQDDAEAFLIRKLLQGSHHVMRHNLLGGLLPV